MYFGTIVAYFLCTIALKRDLELNIKKGLGFFLLNFGTCCFREAYFSYAMKPKWRWHIEGIQGFIKSCKLTAGEHCLKLTVTVTV